MRQTDFRGVLDDVLLDFELVEDFSSLGASAAFLAGALAFGSSAVDGWLAKPPGWGAAPLFGST